MIWFLFMKLFILWKVDWLGCVGRIWRIFFFILLFIMSCMCSCWSWRILILRVCCGVFIVIMWLLSNVLIRCRFWFLG